MQCSLGFEVSVVTQAKHLQAKFVRYKMSACGPDKIVLEFDMSALGPTHTETRLYTHTHTHSKVNLHKLFEFAVRIQGDMQGVLALAYLYFA